MKQKHWNPKRLISSVLCLLLTFLLILPTTLPVFAATGPSITTTLTDGAVQKGSKKTFDVWARNAAGEKIKATVKFNGQKIEPTWDDSEKTSYTLLFTEEGENTVTVSATSDGGKKKELTYHITYQKAAPGDEIGRAVWSIEAFSIGCGYIISPVEMPIYEGETAAEQLIRLLHMNGLCGYYGGSPTAAFYLAYIADGTVSVEKFNGYIRSGTPDAPRTLDLSPAIPSILIPHLQETMTYFDPEDYRKNWQGYLGEFAFTNGSGWMYSVGNNFPNVGFADSYPSDGDVIRVQFTLGYGADIGGFGAMGTAIPDVDNQPTAGYFAVADKDALTVAICRANASGLLNRQNVKSAYAAALAVAYTLNADEMAVRNATEALFHALANPLEDELPDNDAMVEEFLALADGIIAWKKADNGAAPNGYLINDTFLALAGTTPGDWFPIGLGRLGIPDNADAYLAVLKDQVEQRYSQPGKLSAAKATEWHRIILAILAMGGDPTRFGTDPDGNSINLIADGTYDRGKTTSLGRQGINGWIWGLIALDSMRYKVPAGASYTRDDIIVEILRQQLPDGGFALSGTHADPDITAMALQALAPYYNSEVTYTYLQKQTGTEVQKTVYQVVEEALTCLSALQLESGDFASWGTRNVESTDQVVVALCALGIDPLTDPRFIKNGHTLLDGILQYRMPDGGFVHSFTYDPDNPTSLPDQSNTMASEQTLYTMAALWRYYTGHRMLYDFRPEMSESLRERVTGLEAKIRGADASTDPSELTALLTEFYALPESERCYVKNYHILSALATDAGIDVRAIAAQTPVVSDPNDREDNEVLLIFTDTDKAAVVSLPANLTTEYYVTVTALLEKLRRSEDFDGKEVYLQKLTEAKAEIAEIQAEIDDINAEILDKLYPFEGMSLSDRKTVDDIVRRYG